MFVPFPKVNTKPTKNKMISIVTKLYFLVFLNEWRSVFKFIDIKYLLNYKSIFHKQSKLVYKDITSLKKNIETK